MTQITEQQPMEPVNAPLQIVVTVGSDHHPFRRLISWFDAWMDHPGDRALEVVVQHGTATPPRHGKAHRFLDHHDLQALLGSADLVVTQGGPMGIVEARRYGVKPIVVPRIARLGEVVDNHQVAFSRQLAESGLVATAETAPDLSKVLDHAVENLAEYRFQPVDAASEVLETVQRFGMLVSRLPPRHRRFMNAGKISR